MSGQKHVRTVMIILLIIVGGIWYQFMPTTVDNEEVFITIEKGTTLDAAAKQLREAGVIRNPLAFKLYMKCKNLSGEIKPGTHRFIKRLPAAGVAAELVKSVANDISITIPEGYTIAQIQKRYNLKCDKNSDKLIYLTLNVPVGSVNFIPSDSMEGYLYPDTYMIQTDEQDFIKQMTDNFERKVILNYRNEITEAGKKYFGEEDFNESLYKIVTVASLIERETRKPSERPLVASVIYNRLKKGMRLQIDATVSYVPGVSTNNKERTTFRDTRKVSEYNTYKINGLPPGPICNPGIECIKAACNPASTNYLYYVANKDGGHEFSESFEQHKRLKRAVK